MKINKKNIIVFGALILLAVFIIGTITYYKEKGKQVSIPIPGEEMYLIWCYEDGVSYDCSEKNSFEPEESVAISIKLEQFDSILFDPYFLCYYSNLLGPNGELGEQCFPNSIIPSEGFRLEKGITVPRDKEVFTFLKLFVYPDDSFKESDRFIIMDLERTSKSFTGALDN